MVNRGKNKRFVTLMLIGLAIAAAVIVDVISGSTGGGAATPNQSSHSTASGARAANPATTGSAGSGASGGTRATTTGTGNYKTIGTAVNLRSGAGTDSSVITVMSQLGSPVQLSCYLRGTSVADDPWWYRATFINAHGYVAGFWVDTGPDPAKTHLPAC